MGLSKRVARPTQHQQTFCGKNGGAEAKNRKENITIRSSVWRRASCLRHSKLSRKYR
jgi:hypothetical protein